MEHTTPPDTIYGLLHHGAQAWPDRILAKFEDATAWTWARVLDEATAAADVLGRAGIGPGDRVQVMLPNGPGWLRAWWGATLLGAVTAPVNPAYRGGLLSDVCDRIAPAAIVASPGQADLLPAGHRGRVIDPDTLATGSRRRLEPDRPSRPSDTHCLLMTSGTTGPSKASVTTNAHLCTFAAWLVESCGVGADDVFHADMPWFHLSALGPVVQMMRVGGRIAVRSAPAMTDYWSTARASGATFAVAPGTVAQFLESRPESPGDRDHAMRFIVCSPLPADPDGFVRRFGLDGMCTAYGSTESSIPIMQSLATPARAGTCGRRRDGFDVRLVDDRDYEVARGQVGELIVRTDQPWLLSQGYLGHPDATVRAWRNGWFHTGDAMFVDQDGYYHFRDRITDSLRRRGENISSADVEREVLAFPGIREAACVARAGEFDGDDEVMVFVVAHEGVAIDFPELLAFLAGRMAYFMVPRYFEAVDELPKTPSLRVRKHLLRERGDSAGTWDRQAAGYRVTRDGLTT